MLMSGTEASDLHQSAAHFNRKENNRLDAFYLPCLAPGKLVKAQSVQKYSSICVTVK